MKLETRRETRAKSSYRILGAVATNTDASSHHRHLVTSRLCFALETEFYKRENNYNIQHTGAYNSFKWSLELGDE